MAFSEKIKKLRQRLFMSQTAFAQELGVSYTTVKCGYHCVCHSAEISDGNAALQAGAILESTGYCTWPNDYCKLDNPQLQLDKADVEPHDDAA